MKRYLALMFLAGCTPFIEGGIGYSGDAGFHEFDETGSVGAYAIGVEFDHRFLPSECGVYHRSMLTKKPELASNDLMCIKRLYLRRR